MFNKYCVDLFLRKSGLSFEGACKYQITISKNGAIKWHNFVFISKAFVNNRVYWTIDGPRTVDKILRKHNLFFIVSFVWICYPPICPSKIFNFLKQSLSFIYYNIGYNKNYMFCYLKITQTVNTYCIKLLKFCRSVGWIMH